MLAGVGDGGTVSVPVIGHVVCAGFPSPAQDYIEGNVELPRWMAPNPAFTFLFKVGGGTDQRGVVGRAARMRSEKVGSPSADCAASLIRERRRSSSNGSVVSTRPE